MKVKITGPAIVQLNKIDNYYSEADYPRYGKRLRHEIVKASKILSSHPQIGQQEEYLKHLDQGHRYIVVNSSYKLIYLIQKDVIYIVDVFDTRQDPSKMRSNI